MALTHCLVESAIDARFKAARESGDGRLAKHSVVRGINDMVLESAHVKSEPSSEVQTLVRVSFTRGMKEGDRALERARTITCHVLPGYAQHLILTASRERRHGATGGEVQQIERSVER